MAKVPNSVTRGTAGATARRLGAVDAEAMYQVDKAVAIGWARPELIEEGNSQALHNLARSLWPTHNRRSGEQQYIKAFVRTYTRLRARKETP